MPTPSSLMRGKPSGLLRYSLCSAAPVLSARPKSRSAKEGSCCLVQERSSSVAFRRVLRCCWVGSGLGAAGSVRAGHSTGVFGEDDLETLIHHLRHRQ
ncbi:unnamed protein product [Tilletia caries]|nr:unnamed protein product [Tilletia caries]